MLGGGPHSGWALGQKFFALGLKFAGGIILFVAIGYALDRWLGTVPLFTVLGTLAGAGLSFLSVYRDLATEEGRGERSERDRGGTR